MKRSLHYSSELIIILFIFLLGYSCNSASTEKKSLAEVSIVQPEPDPISKGAYLVHIGGCNDCHSPKIMTLQGPVPDSTKLLSGHPSGATLPPIKYDASKPGNWVLFSPDLTVAVGPWGISYSANLTPDSTTGIGGWTEENFIKSMQTGRHLGMKTGRPILPPMPWASIGKMKEEDLKMIFTYLKSIAPIKNSVPQNLSPAEIRRN